MERNAAHVPTLKHTPAQILHLFWITAATAAASIFATIFITAAHVHGVPAAPSYVRDFPDPYILVDGGKYYAYSTGSATMNLRTTSSTDLATWTAATDPLPKQPIWAKSGATWAPSVIKVGNTYVMYYTTKQASSGRQCISVATSSKPQGSFTDSSWTPLVCQTSLGGSIDPNAYKAPDGKLYLYWKSDGSAINQPSAIWMRQLASNGTGWANIFGSPTKLLTADTAWKNGNIESPSVIYAAGKYYLFYGGNLFNNVNYGIGYATCVAPSGPCTDQTPTQAWLGNTGNIVAPGVGNVFTDSAGQTRLSYHSWVGGVGYGNGGIRPMWIGSLSFPGGVPQLQ